MTIDLAIQEQMAQVFVNGDPAPFWRFCPILEFTPHFGDLRSAAIPKWENSGNGGERVK